MKKAAVVFGLSLLFAVSAFAQEWSAAQKEVWKNVEAYNALNMAGDVEGFLAYLHPDYLGWDSQNPMPQNKAALKKIIEYRWKAVKFMLIQLDPVGIQIHGNIAFAHYYFSVTLKDSEGKEKNVAGRYTDILMKQGDKWLVIGDHGGITSKD
jgi:ketosteroid isomerase-like protein